MWVRLLLVAECSDSPSDMATVFDVFDATFICQQVGVVSFAAEHHMDLLIPIHDLYSDACCLCKGIMFALKSLLFYPFSPV